VEVPDHIKHLRVGVLVVPRDELVVLGREGDATRFVKHPEEFNARGPDEGRVDLLFVLATGFAE